MVAACYQVCHRCATALRTGDTRAVASRDRERVVDALGRLGAVAITRGVKGRFVCYACERERVGQAYVLRPAHCVSTEELGRLMGT